MDDQDLLGIKPVAKAVEKSVDGFGSFLGKICMPVADELGLYFQDKVKVWRATNAHKIEEKAQAILLENGGVEGKTVHPLLAWKIVENGSFADSPELQKLWAGLLASSCEYSPDDSNQIFIDILSQLTSIQVRLIEYSCLSAQKYVSEKGFIQAEELILESAIAEEITDCKDIHRLDREMDRMVAIGLLGGSFNSGGYHADEEKVNLTPSPLTLHLFVRCSGSNEDPITFYKAEPKTKK